MFLPINELQNLSDLFSAKLVLGFILIGLLNATLMVFISYKFFQTMQQSGYKGGTYLKWLKKRDNSYLSSLFMLSIMSVLGFILINMALSFIDSPWVKYAGFTVYVFFLAVYFAKESKKKHKVKLVYTKRMIRLVITFVVLTVLLSMLMIFLVNFIAIPFRENLLAEFRYAILCFSPIAVPYLILLAYEINEPLEKAFNKKHITKCKEKLNSYPKLKKIAITGSYGKTSLKEILASILNEKYSVLATPASYNTPLGIAKTVKHLDETHQIFVCEMGARRHGDIKELCDIVKPDVSVITGITYQHIETFGTINNVIKTKSEIIGGAFDGTFITSSDNKYTLDIFENAEVKKYLAGINQKENSLVYVKDLIYKEDGAEFTLVIDKEEFKTTTKLLGSSSIHNIALAAAVAYCVGMSGGEIAAAIPRIKPINHRLELIKTPNGVNVLDDGYNSNPEGLKCAIEALSRFSGRKFVVTPGLVELGHAESGQNFKVGETLSEICDGVILVGRSGSLHVREGLISKEYSTDKIYMVKNLDEAKGLLKDLLKEGDTVLFENDLPDLYV